MPALVVVWTVNSSTERVGELAQRKRISCMELHLEERLPSISTERPFAYHQSHNVPDIEFSHSH